MTPAKGYLRTGIFERDSGRESKRNETGKGGKVGGTSGILDFDFRQTLSKSAYLAGKFRSTCRRRVAVASCFVPPTKPLGNPTPSIAKPPCSSLFRIQKECRPVITLTKSDTLALGWSKCGLSIAKVAVNHFSFSPFSGGMAMAMAIAHCCQVELIEILAFSSKSLDMSWLQGWSFGPQVHSLICICVCSDGGGRQ